MVHPFRSAVPGVTGDDRPRWSVMIPTFNDDRYLEQAITSVLEQDPGPCAMQIEVVDDCSDRDDVRDRVHALAGNRVGYFRQTSNVGVTRNLTTCIQRARGERVHLLHCDDFVLPGFYERFERAFASEPEIGLAFCRHDFVDAAGERVGTSTEEMTASGLLRDHLARMAREQIVMTPSVVVRRLAYEKLGAFDHRLKCAEDWEMWVRIAAEFPVWYETAVGACYRMHGAGNTGRHSANAEELAYTREAIDLIRAYLPSDIADAVHRQAIETYARSAIDVAFERFRLGDRRGMRAYVDTALDMSHSPRVTAGLVRLAGRVIGATVRDALGNARS